MGKINTVFKKQLSDGIDVTVRESTDSRKKIIEFDSDIPIGQDLFLGCVLMFLEVEAPDLLALCSDEFNCH